MFSKSTLFGELGLIYSTKSHNEKPTGLREGFWIKLASSSLHNLVNLIHQLTLLFVKQIQNVFRLYLISAIAAFIG